MLIIKKLLNRFPVGRLQFRNHDTTLHLKLILGDSVYFLEDCFLDINFKNVKSNVYKKELYSGIITLVLSQSEQSKEIKDWINYPFEEYNGKIKIPTDTSSNKIAYTSISFKQACCVGHNKATDKYGSELLIILIAPKQAIIIY